MMKKKMFSGLLAAVMLLAVLPGAAFAEEGGQSKPLMEPNGVISENPLIAPNPQAEMTRSMVVTRLWELSGKPVVNYALDLKDVTEDMEGVEAIRWALSEQLAAGYGDKTFGPNDAVTREQLSTMIYNYVKKFDLGFQGMWMFHLGCKDVGEIREWAVEPMYWMVATKLLDGSAELLLPQSVVTVGEGEIIFTGLVAAAKDKGVDFQNYGKVS